MHRITNLTIGAGPALDLRFDDGTVGSVDLKSLIDGGGVFAALRDAATLAKAHIGHGGRYVEWPGEIDLCADALWLAVNRKADAAA